MPKRETDLLGVYVYADREVVVDDCLDSAIYHCVIEKTASALVDVTKLQIIPVYDIIYLRNGKVEGSVDFRSCKIKGRYCLEKVAVRVFREATGDREAKRDVEELADSVVALLDSIIRECVGGAK